jgi:ubiquitin-conjugating enzyme E2 Q
MNASKTFDKDPPNSPIDDNENSIFPSMTAVVVQDQEKGQYSSQPPVTNDSSSNDNDFLVSEHEDNDGTGPRRLHGFDKDESRRISTDSGAQIIGDDEDDDDEEEEEKSRKFKTESNGSRPVEIPPENDVVIKASGADDILDKSDIQDDESDYSYDYEDDEDGHFSGFIISSDPNLNTIRAQGSSTVLTREDLDVTNNHNVIVDDDQQPQANASDISQFASLECSGHSTASSKKSSWKEPTQEAVSMSLRAEREKSGGRRRLASDLYKVMMTDTKEAGFQVEQKDDECMDKWTVKLFNFDVDSDLHKDMLVLGLDHIELEMSFPEQVSCFFFYILFLN